MPNPNNNVTYPSRDWASDIVEDWVSTVVDKPIMEALFPAKSEDPVMARLDRLESKVDLMIAMIKPRIVKIPDAEEIREYGQLKKGVC